MPDFDGTPMTKREVLIAREAYNRGWSDFGLGGGGIRQKHRGETLYPLSPATRPRVWLEPRCDGGMAWRVVGGELQYTLSTRPDLLEWKWTSHTGCEHEITPKRIRAWADLLANPTETVEDES
jgi:hypothetical protein